MVFKASIGEIISVIGYPGMLFLVMNRGTEKQFYFDGTSEITGIYMCEDIDKPGSERVIYEADIDRVIVPAHKSKEFIASRKAPQLPSKVSELTMDLSEYFRQAKEKKEQDKKALSPHERERIEREEAREYLDYLLDSHSMLADLEEFLGPDDTRQEEMRMIKEEFHEKSLALYGRNTK